jgi:hypothetical protein
MAFIPKGARWYLADVVLEHRIEGGPRNVVHVNTHLIEAESPEQAYEKAIALGRTEELEYANTEGAMVRVIFRGLRGLNVIHEDLEDGAELSYTEAVAVPEEELQRWVRPQEELAVFAPAADRGNTPNYTPQEVMEMLEKRQGACGHNRRDPENLP